MGIGITRAVELKLFTVTNEIANPGCGPLPRQMLRTISSICLASGLSITDLERFRAGSSGEMHGAPLISTAAQLVIIIAEILLPA